jgi:hypothetical protein
MIWFQARRTRREGVTSQKGKVYGHDMYDRSLGYHIIHYLHKGC